MKTEKKIKTIQKARKNALAIVTKKNGIEVRTDFYLFGEKVELHRFKQKIKHLAPFEIIVRELN